ncbi:Os02g0730450, partial [Oryza sativa Japonica Group]
PGNPSGEPATSFGLLSALQRQGDPVDVAVHGVHDEQLAALGDLHRVGLDPQLAPVEDRLHGVPALVLHHRLPSASCSIAIRERKIASNNQNPGGETPRARERFQQSPVFVVDLSDHSRFITDDAALERNPLTTSAMAKPPKKTHTHTHTSISKGAKKPTNPGRLQAWSLTCGVRRRGGRSDGGEEERGQQQRRHHGAAASPPTLHPPAAQQSAARRHARWECEAHACGEEAQIEEGEMVGETAKNPSFS